MDDKRHQITSKQLRTFALSSQIGLGIMTLPSVLAKKVGHDGWIAVILTGVLVLLSSLFELALLKRYKNNSILEINIKLYGKSLGVILNFIFICYTFAFAALNIRLLTGIVSVLVLRETPKIVISFLIALPTTYLTAKGLKVICRFTTLLYLSHIVIIFTFAMIIKDIRITYIMPIAKSDFNLIIKSLPYTIYSFLGFELASVFYPNVVNKEHITMHIIQGVLYTTLFYLIIVVVSVLIFGEMKLKMLVFPIYNIEEAVRVPVIERFDMIFILIWFPMMASSVRNYFFSSYYCVLKIFRIKRKKLLIAVIFIMMFIIGVTLRDIQMICRYINYMAIWGIMNIAFIIISFFISCLKGREQC
ncbi:Spore germination protein B2 [Clostridium ljungdahlii DSM 13528]|uniref:Predicted spore germination protein, permease n=1 Tax=Clostridium ljungdahlii (strain ATCC 55383 / DSM 13528 / PETC) TaxID=748727 RepID=D8GTH5_CLOLD|nr:endospore germination permease [Clostridium ljungdahlii]ADK14624.1 predicted spore germination protein, permease [Clostridium ljungdahlii DSM 13528]OAA85861.1 Spore germination protein B2 [Clostridium ljungdahlii DSM 13528]